MERYAREITRRLPARTRVIVPPRPARGLAGHLWEQSVLPRLSGAGILWSPANTGPLVLERQVVTIHDTIVLDHPEWFNPIFAAWYRVLIPGLARRARRVLTVSACSRERILAWTGINPSHVTVIPPGVDPLHFHPASEQEMTAVREHHGLPNRYLLALGSVEPRKNLERVLAAWDAVHRDFADTWLVIAGGAAASHRRTGAAGAPQVHFLGYAGENCLAGLYAGAQALVFASLDEGFGLPMIEAMACGTPVIASMAGALPETAGGAAYLINPTRTELISHAMVRILTDPDMRHDLSIRGCARSLQFSWDETAESVRRAIEEVDG